MLCCVYQHRVIHYCKGSQQSDSGSVFSCLVITSITSSVITQTVFGSHLILVSFFPNEHIILYVWLKQSALQQNASCCSCSQDLLMKCCLTSTSPSLLRHYEANRRIIHLEKQCAEGSDGKGLPWGCNSNLDRTEALASADGKQEKNCIKCKLVVSKLPSVWKQYKS